MKTPELIPTPDPNIDPGMAELTTELNGHPFVIRGDEEDLTALAHKMLATDMQRAARKPAVSHVEAPSIATNPKPESLSLADLNAREIARLERKAWMHDIKSLGRTSMHKLFIEKLHEERDAKAMMELGIVEAVHCRLHERVVAKARGLTA